jgi:sugar lactone lactonase YvrE
MREGLDQALETNAKTTIAMKSVRLAMTVLLAWCGVLDAADLDELRVKREEIFEFAQKPVVTREGDKVTIAFETTGLCDVTIAIEDSGGKIIRHLVSGVLGPKAPQPLQKDSKKQAVIWDGKNDKGDYAENKDDLTVRVSLGLKPQFERALLHSPYKRFGRNPPVIAAAADGVYVYEGDMADNVRLLDHEGNYVRTVYPFPSDKLDQVQGLRWRTTPDGVKVPFKEGAHQVTFFGSGLNGGFDPASGFGTYRVRPLNEYDGLPRYPAASAMAIHGNRLALIGLYLNRLATDGSSGGLDIHGARTSSPAFIYGYCQPTRPVDNTPLSAAFSPDGKSVYLTGYTVYGDNGTAGAFRMWLHGVLRVPFDGKAAPEVFVGDMNPTSPTAAGTGEKQFNSPTSVACDAEGRVYVSDYVNNRIQIFTPDGKFKESLSVNRPAYVAVHQKTGEIYVSSWAYSHSRNTGSMEPIKPKLTRFEAQAGHKKIAEYALPFASGDGDHGPWGGWMGIQYRVELDSWAEPPTVWLVPGQAGGGGSWAPWGIKVLTVEKDQLTMKKDFGAEAFKAVTYDAASSGRQRLIVNPKTGKVYIMEGMGLATGDRAVEIDPVKGRNKFVDLPFGAEDICFDSDGLIYLRTGDMVVRYDPANWREVPWDYGEEREGVSHCGGRAAKVSAGLALPGTRPGPWFHCGGFGISPKGHLVVQCFNGGMGSNAKLDRPGKPALAAATGKPYTPRIYPGRQRWGEIHIWDKHGKVLHEDVAPGVTITDGVCIDNDDNVYVLTNPMRTPDGKPALNRMTETLIKFKPGRGRVVTSGDGPPVPVKAGQQPDHPTDIAGPYQGAAWVEGADWLYGGVGYAGTMRCTCWNARFSLDYYARSFAPEPDRFSVAVLDTNGNLILRLGKCGNVDDGKPLIADPAIKEPRSIGGDETAIMHACYVAVDTDKRLFIEDAGNRRIASVKLDYHRTETVPLGDRGPKVPAP